MLWIFLLVLSQVSGHPKPFVITKSSFSSSPKIGTGINVRQSQIPTFHGPLVNNQGFLLTYPIWHNNPSLNNNRSLNTYSSLSTYQFLNFNHSRQMNPFPLSSYFKSMNRPPTTTSSTTNRNLPITKYDWAPKFYPTTKPCQPTYPLSLDNLCPQIVYALAANGITLPTTSSKPDDDVLQRSSNDSNTLNGRNDFATKNLTSLSNGAISVTCWKRFCVFWGALHWAIGTWFTD